MKKAESTPSVMVVPLQRRGDEVVLAELPPKLPTLSPELAQRVRWEVDPPDAAAALPREDPPFRPAPLPVPSAWRSEIEAAIEQLESDLATRADGRTIDVWLRGAVVACANHPGEAEGILRLRALMLVLAGEPALCFTAASMQLAMRQWRWWPSGPEVAALCADVARPFRAQLEALKRLLGRIRDETQPTSPLPKTEEDREAVLAKARAYLAEVNARIRSDADRRAPVRTAPLAIGEREEAIALVALYDLQALMAPNDGRRSALEFRARVLREKWGLPTAGKST